MPEVEPVETGENKEKKAKPGGNRSVETDPKWDRIGKHQSSESNSTEYKSKPKADRTKTIRKEVLRVEPVEAGENEEKEANSNENRSSETNPEGGRIGKNRSTEPNSAKYK